MTTLFNAAPASENVDREILANTTILCVNETEVRYISQMFLETKFFILNFDFGSNFPWRCRMASESLEVPKWLEIKRFFVSI